MGIYLLNLSVDAPDAHQQHVSEDLSVNDMESMVELVLEKVLNIENAVPEHEEDDADGFSMIKKSFDFYQQQTSEITQRLVVANPLKGLLALNHAFFQQFKPELIPPPPKA